MFAINDIKKLDMDEYSKVVISAAEFIKDRLYFVTLKTNDQPKSTVSTHYFSIEEQLHYESFYTDFGPLNLSMLYRYCIKVNRKLNSHYLKNKKIVHISTDDAKKRTNAACLIASYAIIYLNMNPHEAYTILNFNNRVPFLQFRDASLGTPYTISLLDCLCGLHKAHCFNFFDFTSFDYLQYEYYERVENGDLNWIIPDKMLGFCGPHNKSKSVKGYPLHAPEFYFKYFRKHNVTSIVRLNKKMYDEKKFTNAGFQHHDLYFIDGSVPTVKILNDFLTICEKTEGAIAVHCKAGLGRTGTLIGCYLMKHYKFTAREAIAWIRTCRPGSVIGHQQEWLELKQTSMWKEGETYRRKMGLAEPTKHQFGIYSDQSPINDVESARVKVNVSGILKKVDTMKLNDKEDNSSMVEQSEEFTQGDKLNQIKAQRRQARALGSTSNIERKVVNTRVIVTHLDMHPIIKNKLSTSLKSSPTSSTRVLTKRNELNEPQQMSTPRRCSQRKTCGSQVSPVVVTTKGKPSLKRIDNGWLAEEAKKEDEKKEVVKTVKRAKRTLAVEKDKVSPRSVKVLRRSHPQGSEDPIKSRAKLQLPVVRTAKSH